MPMSAEDDVLEEDTDEDCYQDEYYNVAEDGGEPTLDVADPDVSRYDCLTSAQAQDFLEECVSTLVNLIQVRPSVAKLLLHNNNWNVAEVARRFTTEPSRLLQDSRVALTSTYTVSRGGSGVLECGVCLVCQPLTSFRQAGCQHPFCTDCWGQHLAAQLQQGLATRVPCMATHCPILVPPDLVAALLPRGLIERHRSLALTQLVKSHPMLRFCSGPDCPYIVRAWELTGSKKVVCTYCKKCFCFQCGYEHHAPTDCETIRKWLTKCADDSETANYISAHTKDCPKCHICIEKNGGCNHMQCYSCKFDFCWMCLQDWKLHGSEYYECSRYKENPNIVNESAHAQAREALKKYLFYFERWENHAHSFRLEQHTLAKIRRRINEKVMSSEGTWIDWQHLMDAAHLLAQCRHTLQYTYPYAYYMESGPRKELFEYQQAQLEAEIENLAWKVEHADSTQRGDLENQMDVAQKRRATLLKDFTNL